MTIDIGELALTTEQPRGGNHTAMQSTVMLAVTGSIASGFAVGSAVQQATFYASAHTHGPNSFHDLLIRLLVNLGAVALALILIAIVGLARRRGWLLVGLIAGIAIVAALGRTVTQYLLGIELAKNVASFIVEFAATTFVLVLGAALGWLLVQTLTRLRVEESRSFSQSAKASAALAALQAEELRVRRDVAEGLHGTVQQRLVLMGARIEQIIDEIGEGAPREAAVRKLISLHAELDHLRQVDVREMSQLLYPTGLEIGIAQAVRMMMRRVPSTIAVDLTIGHEVSELDAIEGGLDEIQRLALIRILEEGVSNALRHGRASKLIVEVRAVDGIVTICIEDDGTGLPGVPHLGGLSLLGHRLEALGGTVKLDPSPGLGGARLRAALPSRVATSFVAQPQQALTTDGKTSSPAP